MLNCLHINFVVFGVRADKADVDCSIRIIDLHDQSIIVSFDVKHHPVAFDDARISKFIFDFGRVVPVFFLDFPVLRQ
jgi:hypothetical protein